MTTEEPGRLKIIRNGVRQNLEEACLGFQTLPKQEHQYFLANCIAAWRLVSDEPLSADDIQKMIEALFVYNEEPEGMANSLESKEFKETPHE